jgi:hypothetical protein
MVAAEAQGKLDENYRKSSWPVFHPGVEGLRPVTALAGSAIHHE